MKKVLLLIIAIIGGYYFFSSSSTKDEAYTQIQSTIQVEGKVIRNFSFLDKKVYELETNSGDQLIITTSHKLRKVGEKVSVQLVKNDLMTIDDKEFSLYNEIE